MRGLLGLLLLLGGSCGRGYSADDPALLLLRQVTLAYLSLTSYHAQAEVMDESERNGFYTRNSVSTQVFWSDPNRLRVDSVSPGRGLTSLNGVSEVAASALQTPLMISSRPLMYDRLLRPNRFAPGQMIERGGLIEVAAASLLADDLIPLGGKAQPCHVLEVTYLLPASAQKEERIRIRLWVDKTSHLVLKAITHRESEGTTQTVLVREMDWNRTLPPNSFERALVPKSSPESAQADWPAATKKATAEWIGTPPPSDPSEQEAAAILRRISVTYRALHSFSAELRSVIESPPGLPSLTRITNRVAVLCARPGRWKVVTTVGTNSEVEMEPKDRGGR